MTSGGHAPKINEEKGGGEKNQDTKDWLARATKTTDLRPQKDIYIHKTRDIKKKRSNTARSVPKALTTRPIKKEQQKKKKQTTQKPVILY